MLGNRNRDTRPELAIRRLVHASGLRYRVAAKPLQDMRRTADMVFRPAKVAVFIDGCFWHGCPEHFRPPKTNPEYWREKIDRNKTRDLETDERLSAAGWLVMRFWEHEHAEACAAAIGEAVAARRSDTGRPRRGGSSTTRPVELHR